MAVIDEKLWDKMDRCSRCHGTGKEPGLIEVRGLYSARLRSVRRDGEIVWRFRCPSCGEWADIDDDQLHGRVSIDHTETGCEFHETHDLWTMAGLDA